MSYTGWSKNICLRLIFKMKTAKVNILYASNYLSWYSMYKADMENMLAKSSPFRHLQTGSKISIQVKLCFLKQAKCNTNISKTSGSSDAKFSTVFTSRSLTLFPSRLVLVGQHLTSIFRFLFFTATSCYWKLRKMRMVRVAQNSKVAGYKTKTSWTVLKCPAELHGTAVLYDSSL